MVRAHKLVTGSFTGEYDTLDEALAVAKEQVSEGQVFGVEHRGKGKFYMKRGTVTYPISASAAATFSGRS